jgi:predicted aconitase
MKHFGAALASYESVAMFHIAGITPEARGLADVRGSASVPEFEVGESDIRAFRASYASGIEAADVVVFSAPQLSTSVAWM